MFVTLVSRFDRSKKSMRELAEDLYFPTAKTTLGCSRPKPVLGFSVIVSCLVTLNSISSDVKVFHFFLYAIRTQECIQTANWLLV
ncbi:hypothetical protein L6452_34729 [Arctium lappa]|uniref:Uncharacterized protein n=1 Tax=Arctium lappa TaxID=4217 RepID=A0ACB8YJ97_ARCLA|nr:hypothetical protein L6452_34729 [Arctium lappa]